MGERERERARVVLTTDGSCKIHFAADLVTGK